MNIRWLRGGLAVLMALIVVSTVQMLRHPSGRPSLPTGALGTKPGSKESRVEDFVYRAFKNNEESLVVDAKRWEGSQQGTMRFFGVTTTFKYQADNKQGKTTVKADRCTYTQTNQKADYEGNVVLTTQDGLELHTDSLHYRGDKQLARTEDPVAFKYGRFSGSSKGMVYKADVGEISLLDEAYVRVEDEKGGPPTEVRSQNAEAKRSEGTLVFEGEVRLTRAADNLTSERLSLSFSTEDRALVAAEADGNVDLERAPGSAPLPGLGSSAGRGPRSLKTGKLFMTFRHDRTPEAATAQGGAELIALPGPGDVQERRDLKAKILMFGFDEKGRVNELQGRKDVFFRADPLPGSMGLLPRTGSCNTFVAQIEPDSGSIKNAEFTKDVVFTRAAQKAKADLATYSGETESVFLKGTPELEDTEQGTSLKAGSIDLSTRTGDIIARHLVRNILRKQQSKGKKPAKPAPPGEDTTVLACERLDQMAKTRTTVCQGSALLRRRQDEIRAPTIRVSEDAQGRQLLRAESSALEPTSPTEVVTLMHPESQEGKKPPEVVEGRSRLLVYEEARNQVVYTGNVVIKQGDLASESPEATMTLSKDATSLRSIVAGEPVKVTQRTRGSTRVGTGSRATYDPVEQTVLVIGEDVTLQDGTQRLAGRALTFHSGEGRALMEGLEEARTQAVLKREPVKP